MVDEKDVATFRMLEYWNSPITHLKKQAHQYILKQASPFLAQLQLLEVDNDDSVKSIYEALVDQTINYWDKSGSYDFHMQIFVFHRYTGTLLLTVPELYDQGRRPLFLIGEEYENNLCNLSIITNIYKFFNLFGTFCFFCKKMFKGRGSQHNCSQIPTCFVCKRAFKTPKYFETKLIENYFCPSSIYPQTAVKCSDCNLRVVTTNCRKVHKQKVCRFGWLCQQCNRYIYRTKFFSSHATIKQAHVCGVTICKFCGDQATKFHQCLFRTPKVSESLTKLAFFELKVTGRCQTHCPDCFGIENYGQNICDFCQDNDVFDVSGVSLLYEKEREKFYQAIFFSFSEGSASTDPKSFPYLPPTCQAQKGQETFFNQVPKKRLLKGVFIKKKMNALEKLFEFLLSKDIRHTTFITHDEEKTGTLNEVLQCFLSNGIIPRVVGNTNLMLIEIPEVGWRFLNSINYIDKKFFTANSKSIFFPNRWNKASYFSYTGSPPCMDDFFNVEDSAETINFKKEFVRKLSCSWNFRSALEQYLFFRVYCTSDNILSFTREAFACQMLLQEQIGNLHQPHQPLKYILPFNPPLFTRASYAFQLLMYFTRPLLLKAVNPPIPMTSSRQELEFCSFLRWKYPNHTFIDAWSPFGQKKFKETFPDSYCIETKTAFFFNGCLIHGHPLTQCKLNRNPDKKLNYFKVPLHEAFANFQKKIKQLEKNHPTEIHDVEIVWECYWQFQKKVDTEVKIFFSKKFYKEPPLSRLDARAAVRGGINEVFACKWKCTLFKNQIFYYIDLISLYPFTASQILPIGEYEVRRRNT